MSLPVHVKPTTTEKSTCTIGDTRTTTPDALSDDRKSSVPGAESGDGRSLRRHSGGARVNLSRPIVMTAPGRTLEGWALNISRGGVRVLVEESLAVGELFDLSIGDDGEPDSLRRKGRIAWVQEGADGAIAGVEFTDGPGISSHTMRAVTASPSAPPAPPTVPTTPVIAPAPAALANVGLPNPSDPEPET